MLDAAYELSLRNATWSTVAILIFPFVLCLQGFEWRRRALGVQVKILDARFGYNRQDVHDLFASMSQCARRLYAKTEMTLDLIFPPAYGGLLIALTANLIESPIGKYAVAVPALAVLFDWTENAIIAYLAWTFESRTSGNKISLFVAIASASTRAKTVLGGISVLIVLGSALAHIFNIPPIVR